MKAKLLLVVGCLLAVAAGTASAALGDVSPVGLTGLWTFHDNPTYQTARFGTDLVGNAMGTSLTGPWTDIGTQADPLAYSDGKIVQNQTYNSYLTVTHNIGANGGGIYTNEYTLAMDYKADSGTTSLFNTITNDTLTNPAELRYLQVSGSTAQIGSEATGYSGDLNSNTWHRIVLTVDNGSFYKVFIDGTKVLDAPGQAIDGDFSLGSAFNLFTGAGWSDKWGLLGTVATWGRALSETEVADMGGWIDGASMPTALVLVPEPATMALLAFGGLLAVRRKR